ncbi:MAG: pentapeptide repeat-containing protein [Kineothrix sp.]|nr:pentapeptide repeat-containing protein [Kineothrix sp.]
MVKQCSINIQKNIFHLYIHAPFQSPETLVRNANLRNANLRNANLRSRNLQIENFKF